MGAFRHEFHWKRPSVEALKDQVLKILDRMSTPAGPNIRCLNLIAEPGSGLTMVLQLLAFHAADRGYPTLLARDPSQGLEFEVLRTFLVELEHGVTDSKIERVPVVIVVDASVNEQDPTNTYKELPRRLRADSRRVLLIRGAHNGKDVPTPQGMETEIDFGRLRSDLDQEEYGKLKEWVRGTYARLYPESIDAKIHIADEWIADGSGSVRVPLLVGLYFLLNEDLRRAADLGKHLLRSLDLQLAKVDRQEAETRAREGTKIYCRDGTCSVLTLGRATRPAAVAARHLVEALIVTAAVARLNESLPRPVLQKLLGTDVNLTYGVLNRLEQTRLIKTDLLGEGGTKGRRVMPVSYYQDCETVTMVHRLYGPMVLDSIPTGSVLLQGLVEDSPLCREMLEIHHSTRSDGRPLEFFGPVFRTLDPGVPSHRWFAEFISMLYLRPQRYTDPGSYPSLSLLDRMLKVFGWLLPIMIETSGPLLHSRALVQSAMACRLGDHLLDESRKYFRAAIADIQLAIELEAERPGGEDLGNLKTTLGLVHRDWAVKELWTFEGDKVRWQEQSKLAEDTLREAYDLKQDSYAAHALANLLIHQLERQMGVKGVLEGKEDWFPKLVPEEVARSLSESLQLLSREPELAFEDQWSDTMKCAVLLLDHERAQDVIFRLKQNRDEMGYVLEAIRILRRVPRQPTSEPQEVERLRRASLVLVEAEDRGVSPSALGNLLRYAIFSSQPERDPSHRSYRPAYRERYKLIRRLLDQAGSFYLKEPVWRYDVAMLCFQNRQIPEGRRHFMELRKGYRYMYVPSERSVPWVRDPDNPTPTAIVSQLRITRIDRPNDRGWGRLIDERLGYDEEIPFRISLFTARRIYGPEMFQPGRSIDCRIQLRPAGPYAIPAEE